MKKLFVCSLFALALVGCDASYKDDSGNYIMPEELKHCKVFNLIKDGSGSQMKVLYCEDKKVTNISYQHGKQRLDTAIVQYIN